MFALFLKSTPDSCGRVFNTDFLYCHSHGIFPINGKHGKRRSCLKYRMRVCLRHALIGVTNTMYLHKDCLQREPFMLEDKEFYEELCPHASKDFLVTITGIAIRKKDHGEYMRLFYPDDEGSWDLSIDKCVIPDIPIWDAAEELKIINAAKQLQPVQETVKMETPGETFTYKSGHELFELIKNRKCVDERSSSWISPCVNNFLTNFSDMESSSERSVPGFASVKVIKVEPSSEPASPIRAGTRPIGDMLNDIADIRIKEEILNKELHEILMAKIDLNLQLKSLEHDVQSVRLAEESTIKTDEC